MPARQTNSFKLRIRPTGRPWAPGMALRLAALSLASVAAWAQGPTVASVLNIGDYSTNLCPGLSVAIYGTNFGSSASGVSFMVGGKPGYILNVSPNQINGQIPFEVSPGPTTLVVTVSGSSSPGLPITLAAVAPSFVTADGSGSGSGGS